MTVESRTHVLTTLAAWPAAARGAAGAAAFVALLALAAQVRVPLPFTPVPLTLQVLVVALAGYALGARWAGASMTGYLALGLAGAPVFAAGGAGLSVVASFTGGYLLAYPLAAVAIGVLTARAAGPGRRVLAGLAGLALIHVGGALWMVTVAPSAPGSALALLTWTFLPFVGVDVVKVLVAERLSRRRAEGE